MYEFSDHPLVYETCIILFTSKIEAERQKLVKRSSEELQKPHHHESGLESIIVQLRAEVQLKIQLVDQYL